MGWKLRRRSGLVAVLAVVFSGLFAPSALANTPLTITKTATAHWTRTYDWTIDKAVDKPTIELKSGSWSTATYNVTVTKSAGVEAIWVDGTVCVSNEGPLATENLTVTDRVVAFHANGTRTLVKATELDLSANPVLDAGESYCYPYSFPIEPFPGATGYANEARATITNDPRGPEPVGPGAEAPFTFPASPTLVNDTVNVDDTNGLSWLFAASGSKTYTRTFMCDRDKGTHVNTAKIRETGQSDSASVTVTCKEKPRDCPPKGHHGKDKDKDNYGYGHSSRGGRDDDRYGGSSRGRDDDRCDDDHNGGHDDHSDDSDSSDDSDDGDCKGDRRWGH